MMNKNKLGRLQRITELREVWENEAYDFTPWLAEEENIVLLGDTIGIELEVEAKEQQVGPFKADILCKATATGHWVLIENQLERTDHTHLGQLITYAAGLNAVTIVWIAQRFTDEHRAALDWLNEVTSEDVNFFALEIELWRIGDSPIAPKFNVVSSPNDWKKGTITPPTLTPARELQVEFWSAFREYVQSKNASFKTTKALPQHWMNIAIGRVGFKLNAIASFYDTASESYEKHELRAELELYDNNSKAYFAQLMAMKREIESELGEPLVWYNPEDKRACRMYVRKTVDLHHRPDWPAYHEWLKQKLENLRRVFGPRIRVLDAEGFDDVVPESPQGSFTTGDGHANLPG